MFRDTKFAIQQDSESYYVRTDIPLNAASESRPTLTCLHGLFGGISNFDGITERLEHEFPVFIPEIPFCYAREKNIVSISEMSDWMIERLDEHNIENTVLIGNSLGGHIALDLAIRYPNRITSLILTGSSGLHEHLHGASMPKRFDREYTRSIANKTFINYEVTESELDQIQRVFEDRALLMNMLRVARSARKYDLRDRISEIHKPVQLIWGKDDIITPPSVGEEFKTKLPAAELHIIEQCGHSPMLEQPEKFTNLLRIFLNTITAKQKVV